jgi:hypothetical protein
MEVERGGCWCWYSKFFGVGALNDTVYYLYTPDGLERGRSQ